MKSAPDAVLVGERVGLDKKTMVEVVGGWRLRIWSGGCRGGSFSRGVGLRLFTQIEL